MEWIERLNAAIEYIEEHITEEPSFEQIAKTACCSVYHFQRMFAYMADTPLSEYIRRRRMSLAAADLQSGEKVVDVALKYGYASPTAFNRAFQSIHGVAPSLARESGITLKAFPAISFKITIKGVEEMDYRIEKKEEFRIVGISMPMHRELEKNFEVVPQMWGKAAVDGTLSRLAALMEGPPMGMLGVSNSCDPAGPWKYFIAVASSKEIDSTLEEFLVPAATWAVFCGSGTNTSIQELEKRILTEWLPSSGYEYGNAPDVEVYLNADPQNAKYEVWLPVIKKQA